MRFRLPFLGKRASANRPDYARQGGIGRRLVTGVRLGVNTTNAHVDEFTAIGLPAVWACVNAISKDLSALPLRLVQLTDDRKTRQAVEHPAYSLFTRSPDGNTTPMNWRQAAMGHVLIHGNAYAEIVRWGARGLALELRDPRAVRTSWDADNRLVYLVNGKPVDRSKFIHFAGLGNDGATGYSAVLACRQAIALGLVGERFAGSFLSNGNQASGLLKTEAEMTPEAADELLDGFIKMTSASNAGGMGILPPGVSFEKISVDPHNAQMIESRRFQVLEICRLFGVPPHKVMDFSGASYSTIEASNLEYATSCLGPWAEMIEQSLNLRLLTADEQAAGYGFRHDFRQLLKGDSTARAAYWRALVEMGVVNQNTVAVEEGFDPHEGGEVYLVPLNKTSNPQGSNPA